MTDLRESFAALCHAQWSGWMEYLFSRCVYSHSDYLIPAWAIERWMRQINTPYSQLSEQEKESDRKEANKFLALLNIETERDLANEEIVSFRVAYHQALEEIAELRRVLEMVEWVKWEDFGHVIESGGWICPWCKCVIWGKHRPDCPRQAVLGLSGEVQGDSS